MGAFLAKYFSAIKNSSDISDISATTTWKFDNYDGGAVAMKMKTRITVTTMDTNDNYVSSDLNKYVRGSVSVGMQLFPLQSIEDKKLCRKDEQNGSIFVTERKKRTIGLKRCKVSVPRNVDKKEAQVDLKRLKLPPSLRKEIISNKSCSSVHLNHVKVNPKTLKERKTNQELLTQFNEDHSDDMFDFIQIPNHFSQMNLLETSSSSSEDEEALSDDQPGTSIINQIPQFSGWSAQTPDRALVESEADEDEKLKAQSDEYVHKTIKDRRNKLKSSWRVEKGIDNLANNTGLSNGASSMNKRRKPFSLKDFLSDLNPALEKLNKSQRDLVVDDDIEMEPYFDEDI